MKKHQLFIILFALLTTGTFGQTWERLFSRQSSDVFRWVKEVSTGGYIAAGYTADSTVNDSDAYVVRLNQSGDTMWTYQYNGQLSRRDLFYKIIETTDGGFLALGYTNSVSGNTHDILYIKLSSSGNEQWVKTWGGTGTERGQDLVETSNGYTICGYTTSTANYFDALLIHVDFSGNVVWTKNIGTADYEDSNAILLLPDGGYLLGGQARVNANFDMFLIRTDSAGDTLWTKNFGTAGIDNIESMVKVSDGYVLTGGATSSNGDNNGILVKVDTSGNMLWLKIFGGDDQDDFHSIDVTDDGGFILCGTVSSYGQTKPNLWLLKTDQNGDSLWVQTLGGDSHDHGYCAMQTSDGGFIAAGHSGSFGYRNEDGYIAKTDPTGAPPNVLRYVRAYKLETPYCTDGNSQDVKVVVRNFGFTDESNVQLTVDLTGSVTQTLNATIASLPGQSFQIITLTPQVTTTGSITFNGYTNVDNDVYPNLNGFTKTITPCTGIEDIETIQLSLYPNPVSDKITIELASNSKAFISLIDSRGSIIKQHSTESNMASIDLTEIPEGIYIVKVATEEGVGFRKIVVIR